MHNTVDLRTAGQRPNTGFGLRPRKSGHRRRLAFLQKASSRIFIAFVLFVCAGYLIQGRTFAYLGLPGLYPGEMVLLWAAAKHGGNLWDTFGAEFQSRPLLPLALISFITWGGVETFRGYLGGYSLLDSLRGFATHYYPLLLYVGLAVGSYISVDLIRKYFNYVNVLMGISAVAAAVITERFQSGIALPWKPEVMFPGGPAVPCLTFLFVVALARRVDIVFVASAGLALLSMLLGTRSSVLGGILGLAFLLFRPKRRMIAATLVAGTALVFTLTAVLPAFHLDFGGRIGTLTPVRVAARVVAIFDADLARSVAAQAGESASFIDNEAGTVEWRKTFWNAVVNSMKTNGDWLMGHGYGFSLGSLMSAREGFNESIRTPHNFAVFLLGYTGFVGCALYAWLLLAFIADVIRCPGSRIKDGIIAGGIGVIVMGLSGNLFETPFGAVPTYLAFGILLGLARKWPAIRERRLRGVAIRQRPPIPLNAQTQL